MSATTRKITPAAKSVTKKPLPKPGRKASLEEALDSAFKKFPKTLEKLAQ